MKDAADKKIFSWRGKDDTDRLADVIADAAAEELFTRNGELVVLNRGNLSPVGLNDLREIIGRHIATIRLTSRGTAGWTPERISFDFPHVTDATKAPNQRVLLDLIGALALRVAKAPSDPPHISAQHEREIRTRLKSGEPRSNIARAYGIDIEVVEQLAR